MNRMNKIVVILLLVALFAGLIGLTPALAATAPTEFPRS